MRPRFKTLMPAATAAFLLLAAQAAPVRANSVLSFSGASITGTWNIFQGTTTISTGGAEKVTITSFNGSSTPFSAWLNLSEKSTTNASSSGGGITQKFAGSFTINSQSNGHGTNYLSGSLAGTTFQGSGSSATMVSSSNSITYSSSVIANLAPPSGASFSLTSVSPNVSFARFLFIPVSTLASFRANGSGSFSADPPASAPEPSSLAIAGIGAVGIIGYGLRRRKALGV
jgi:hypothetical protein